MRLDEIGVQVTRRKDALGLSITGLAKLNKVSAQTISKLERGTLKEIGFVNSKDKCI